MDAVEFLKARRRICEANAEACYSCPLSTSNVSCLLMMTNRGSENVVVDKVEQWVKEHPAKTRQSEFLKMYPNAPVCNGVIVIAPCKVDKTFECKYCGDCSLECRRDYWLQEIQEEE